MSKEKGAGVPFDTVVVGGGVAGLYCAWKLCQRQSPHRLGLFESSDRYGGRIETHMFGSFKAEFGPMRFEKHGQPKLMELLAALHLETKIFPNYTAENPAYPIYDLRPDEMGPLHQRYTTLELMKLGIIRILKENEKYCSDGNPDDPRDPKHHIWLSELDEPAYDAMRREAKQNGEFLYNRGLWNALSDVLSHQALVKIRDLGSFYHLIPENPNAIEWIIFWLRGLKPTDHLVKITDGSQSITDKLVEELEKNKKHVTLCSSHTLTKLQRVSREIVCLEFTRKDKTIFRVKARHVILALPKCALSKLANCFLDQTKEDLECVLGIPLLKCIFLVEKPWWNDQTPTQTRASQMPTREVHYFYDKEKKQGLVMLYTDRPALEYWAPFVKGNVHDRAEIGRKADLRLVDRFFKYLAGEIYATVLPERLSRLDYARVLQHKLEDEVIQLARSMNNEQELSAALQQRVKKFGIRDWSREPYGAAAHTWKPGVKSWEVLDRLKAFSLSKEKGDVKNIHICGEAYCDYNGFIEGSLRSADDVLDTI